MMRSLYSGVSGLRNHQTRMDVIGNNIANVNTVGYKASRVVFQDIYSQTIKPASGPQTVPTPIGGTNAMQIGLGMNVQAIDVLFNSAAAQYTGAPFDLCIQGDGFFVVNTGYTPAAGGNPKVPGTDYYTRAGNLYVDKAGNLLTANGYSVMGYANIEAGNYKAAPPDEQEDPDYDVINGLVPLKIDDKYKNIAITDKGEIVGTWDNQNWILGKIPLATFTNNQGLEKCGQNMYRETINSGEANVDFCGEDGSGMINPGSLEMSNVDLAGEFTDMIVTQRGFQANSRIITVSDTMLEELINLKR